MSVVVLLVILRKSRLKYIVLTVVCIGDNFTPTPIIRPSHYFNVKAMFYAIVFLFYKFKLTYNLLKFLLK